MGGMVEGSTQSGERNWQKWVLASQRHLRVLKTGSDEYDEIQNKLRWHDN
jgi:hypothetical protein